MSVSIMFARSKHVAKLTNSYFFFGTTDAGKSTMGGNILFLTGMVDKRTMEKYEKEAKEAGRESWYLSWALDTNIEERAKVSTSRLSFRGYLQSLTFIL